MDVHVYIHTYILCIHIKHTHIHSPDLGLGISSVNEEAHNSRGVVVESSCRHIIEPREDIHTQHALRTKENKLKTRHTYIHTTCIHICIYTRTTLHVSQRALSVVGIGKMPPNAASRLAQCVEPVLRRSGGGRAQHLKFSHRRVCPFWRRHLQAWRPGHFFDVWRCFPPMPHSGTCH